MLNFITSLALKFNERLSELPADRLLKEVYNVDQALFEEGYKSWYSFINQSVNKLSISSDSVYGHQTLQYILSRYANDISTELKCMISHEHDNKLNTLSFYIMNFVFRHIYHLAYQSELPKN